MLKVSIIIPIYNVEQYLPKCLESVINQTYKNLEIICVNDCSPDDSLKICQGYAQKDSRIKLINREQNGGLSAARNSGLEVASGEYVYFIDSDDYIDSDYIEKMVQMIEKHSVDMVLNTHILQECGDKSKPFPTYSGYAKQLTQGEFVPKEMAINLTMPMIYLHLYKKAFLDKYHLRFPEGYIHEDEYFQCISKIHLDALFVFYGPAYHYLQRENSIMASRKSKIEGYVKIFTLIYEFYKNNKLLDKDTTIKCFRVGSFACIKNEQEFLLTKDYIELISKDFEKCPKASTHAEKYIFNAIKESKTIDEYKAKVGKNAFLTYMTRQRMQQKAKGYKVSIIIPVYNTEKYLRKCLDSVCNQTLQDIEIICVNDCSTDDSLEILKEYASNDNRIKIINFTENKGVAVARNTAIEQAKGEYIGFVDSDDYVDLDFYEKLYERALKNKADIVVGNYYMYFDNQNTICGKDFLAQIQKNKVWFNGLFVLAIYSKKLVQANHIKFTENFRYGEDRIFPILAVYHSSEVETMQDIFYHIQKRNDSSSAAYFNDTRKINDFIKSSKEILIQFNSLDYSEDDYLIFFCEYLDYILSTLIQANDECKSMVADLYCYFYENAKFKTIFSQKYNAKILEYIQNKNFSNIALERQKTNLFKGLRQRIQPQIPKRIFYVWFGGQKSTLANICIDNWQDKLQGFEFIEINENSPYFDFQNEYKTCKWFREIYNRKLWAFASDYARVKVLYEYGGVYLDTDITIKKDLAALLKHSFFIGEEEMGVLSAGIFGAVPKHPFLKAMLDFYQQDMYKSPLYMIPQILTKIYEDNEFADIYVYPPEFFYPFHYNEIYSPQCITPNTYTIHWWGASWISPENLAWLENKSRLAPHLEILRERVAK